MIYAGHYGYTNGDVYKLIAPIDADNNFCGFGKMKGYPNMMFNNFQLTEALSILKSGVCIKDCPQSKDVVFKEGENCKSNSKEQCPTRSYNTIDFVGYCFPQNSNGLTEEEWVKVRVIKQMFLKSKTGVLFNDLFTAQKSIQISMGLSLVWSLVFIFLMSIFAEPVLRLLVLIAQLGLLAAAGGAGYFCYEAVEDRLAAKTEDDIPEYNTYIIIGTGLVALIMLTFFICSCWRSYDM
jgi:hypothetical protein